MRHAKGISGFTLIELLVVIALIAVLSAALIGGLAAAKTPSLQSGQIAVANIVAVARAKAGATGRKTRILFNIDSAAVPPGRFLNFIVLQLARETGSSPANWDTIERVSLPEGVYVLPSSLTLTEGLIDDLGAWKRGSDATQPLVSDLLSTSTPVTIEEDTAAQLWAGFAFTANGTMASITTGTPPKGMLVLATGRPRVPGSFASGASPIRLGSPQNVRGLSLSAYGIASLLSDQNAF